MHIILAYFSEGMSRSESEPLVELMVVGVRSMLLNIACNGERAVGVATFGGVWLTYELFIWTLV